MFFKEIGIFISGQCSLIVPSGPSCHKNFRFLTQPQPAGMAKREQICPKMAKTAHISICNTLARPVIHGWIPEAELLVTSHSSIRPPV